MVAVTAAPAKKRNHANPENENGQRDKGTVDIREGPGRDVILKAELHDKPGKRRGKAADQGMRRRNAAVRNVLIEHGKAEPLQQNLPEAAAARPVSVTLKATATGPTVMSAQ